MLNKIYKGQDKLVVPNDKTRVNRNYLETYGPGYTKPITTVSRDGIQTMYINPEYYGSVDDELANTSKLQQAILNELQQNGITLEEVTVYPRTYTQQERTNEYLSTPAPGELGEQGYVYNPFYVEMPWWKKLLSDYYNYYDHYYHEKYINPTYGQYPILRTIPVQYINQNGEISYFDGGTMYDENGNPLFSIPLNENNNGQAIITNNNDTYIVNDNNAVFDDNGKLIPPQQFDGWHLTMTDHLNAAGIDIGNMIAITLTAPIAPAEDAVIEAALWAPKIAKWMPKTFKWMPKITKNFANGLLEATFQMYPSLPKYGAKALKMIPKLNETFPEGLKYLGYTTNMLDNTYKSYLFPYYDMDVPNEWKNWDWHDWTWDWNTNNNGLTSKGFTILNTLTLPSDIINARNPYNTFWGINGMAKAINEQLHKTMQPSNNTVNSLLNLNATPDENGNIQLEDDNGTYDISNNLMKNIDKNIWTTIDGKLTIELDDNGELNYWLNE